MLIMCYVNYQIFENMQVNMSLKTHIVILKLGPHSFISHLKAWFEMTDGVSYGVVLSQDTGCDQ